MRKEIGDQSGFSIFLKNEQICQEIQRIFPTLNECQCISPDQARARPDQGWTVLSPLKLDVHFIVCGLAGVETRRQSVLAQLIFPWLSFRDDN